MSRMLEALRQIDSKRRPAPPTVSPVSEEEMASLGLNRPATPWAQTATATEESKPDDAPVPDEARADVPPAVVLSMQSMEPAAGDRSDAIPESRMAEAIEDDDSPACHDDPQLDELADRILSRCRPDRSTVLLFTSPGDGEGKTSTLISLSGVLAARLGDDVVLVDANYVRPDVARCLGLSVDRGLVEVLEGTVQWPQVICPTRWPHLSVLPGGRFRGSGGIPPGPLTISSLLRDLRDYYRLVLLDAPSLAHPFVASMARHCEGVYLTVQLGRTRRRAIPQAVRVLEECDGHLLGCIVTEG